MDKKQQNINVNFNLSPPILLSPKTYSRITRKGNLIQILFNKLKYQIIFLQRLYSQSTIFT